MDDYVTYDASGKLVFMNLNGVEYKVAPGDVSVTIIKDLLESALS